MRLKPALNLSSYRPIKFQIVINHFSLTIPLVTLSRMALRVIRLTASRKNGLLQFHESYLSINYSEYDSNKVLVWPKSCFHVSKPEDIESALYEKGPLAVGISVGVDMQLYSGGIFNGKCGPGINHT